jgi:hypothetical protein
VDRAGEKASVRSPGGDRAGEVRLSRFFHNSAVTVEEMTASAAVRTSQSVVGRHVLAIQDTTSVRSDAEGGGGLNLHAMVAVDAEDGALLGLVEALYLTRTSGRRDQRKAVAFEDKESQRWLQGARSAALICSGARRVTVIADRESDIYEAFVNCPQGVELLIRAAQDRALEDKGRLFAALDALPEAGRQPLQLPARAGHKPRVATMAARVLETEIKKPSNRPASAGLPAMVKVTAVDIREVDPPAGAAPLHWRLLSTAKVDSATAAFALADLYRRRWAIEQLFRTLKTEGFAIEALRQAEDLTRQKLVTVLLIAAVIVQQLVHARDGAAPTQKTQPRPILDAFHEDDIPFLEQYCAELEGKTERQKNPHPKRTLAYASWVCARLGGWTGYYGKPGPIVMLRGWRRFQNAKAGWTMANIKADLENL